MAAAIVVSTHEGMLVGWQATVGDGGVSIELEYAFKAHAGPIQCLMSTGQLLLCGCADGTVEIFNVRTKSSVGQLLEHKSGITSMSAHGGHVLIGDTSGALMVWRNTDWTPLTTLKGHVKAVNGIAIHPSGRSALSVGDDSQLILWDLVKGRQAFAQTLSASARAVRWVEGDEANAYELVYDKAVALHDGTSGAKIVESAIPDEPGVRVRCSCRVRGSGPARVVVGMEGGAAYALSLDKEQAQHKSKKTAQKSRSSVMIHDKRVRAMASFSLGDSAWIATCGGDGEVKMWGQGQLSGEERGEEEETVLPIATLTSAKGFRVTDLIVIGSGKPAKSVAESVSASFSSPSSTPSSAPVQQQAQKQAHGSDKAAKKRKALPAASGPPAPGPGFTVKVTKKRRAEQAGGP